MHYQTLYRLGDFGYDPLKLVSDPNKRYSGLFSVVIAKSELRAGPEKPVPKQ